MPRKEKRHGWADHVSVTFGPNKRVWVFVDRKGMTIYGDDDMDTRMGLKGGKRVDLKRHRAALLVDANVLSVVTECDPRAFQR